jgi:surface protein
MSKLFRNKDAFNEDISGWDTSKVTNMYRMFLGADAFNQPIGEWNTGQVTNMNGMFYGANGTPAFNQPIGEWDTRQVTDIEFMFYGAVFNQDLSDWCVPTINDSHRFGNYDGTNPSWQGCPCTTSNSANTDCTALTNDNINTARDLWFSDEGSAIATYGHIKDW